MLEYKNALAKYFPGEAPDYASLEGFVAANILIDALKRTGAQLDTEKLVDALESTRNLDLGLGVPLNFGRSDHQASHKIWGTALDETGRFQPVDLEYQGRDPVIAASSPVRLRQRFSMTRLWMARPK